MTIILFKKGQIKFILFLFLQIILFLITNGSIYKTDLSGKEQKNTPPLALYEVHIVKRTENRNGTRISHDLTDVYKRQRPFCSRDQIIRRGRWKAIERPEAPYTATERWEQTCYKTGKRKGDLERKPFLDHEWVVQDDCIFQQFNVDSFCKVVQNRTISFFGDSLSWQQYHSLIYLLQANVTQTQTRNCASLACGNSSKLTWSRDNHASRRGLEIHLQNHDPDIIVFNRGAHFQPDKNLLIQELNETLQVASKWQQDCDTKDRDCMLLWRTTAPGFPDCEDFPGPISNRTEAELIIQNTTWYDQKESRKKFQWWKFAEQNRLVEHFILTFQEIHKLRISFLDFYNLAILRPDQHIGKSGDCLHWCLPGPMDTANTLLLHELKVAAAA